LNSTTKIFSKDQLWPKHYVRLGLTLQGGEIPDSVLNTRQMGQIHTNARRERGKGKGPLPMIGTSFSKMLRNKEALNVISLLRSKNEQG